jgi:hypothetical protein
VGFKITKIIIILFFYIEPFSKEHKLLREPYLIKSHSTLGTKKEGRWHYIPFEPRAEKELLQPKVNKSKINRRI